MTVGRTAQELADLIIAELRLRGITRLLQDRRLPPALGRHLIGGTACCCPATPGTKDSVERDDGYHMIAARAAM